MRLRDVRPDDKPLFVEGFAHLSEDSRYLRFFGTKKSLNEDELHYLTEVDGVRHVAIGALDDEGHGVGVGRYVMLDDAPGVAEVAVTVVDELQGRGLGHVLVEHLVERARAAGNVRSLRFWVLPINVGMRHLLEDLGARFRQRDGSTECWELDVNR
ncbi:MAG TPA: GNAT family N-acetyltransferase [Sandaracinaceae bacterium LLY-WYZ-13_1]|nr:GNAT family N-acetyltransferase [Sandaracinaceae bacterium LLY-WYZ-13_1]